MRENSRGRLPRLGNLLASSSVAAILIGGGTPRALAACTPVPTAGVSNSGTVSGYCINNETVSGNVSNNTAGKITASGISFTSGTLTGHIVNSGMLAGGINLDAASAIHAGAATAISLSGRTFTGGISNAGVVSGGVDIEIRSPAVLFSNGIINSGTLTASGAYAIQTFGLSTFLGGITNNGGTITAKTDAIDLFGGRTFSGGIVNTSGTIGGGSNAIVISVPTFTAGITNGGTITATGNGGLPGQGAIVIESSVVRFGASSAGGGIVNTGTIAGGAVGASVSPQIFFGGISNNGGVISGTRTGAFVAGISTFNGDISNSGTISGGTGGGLVLGAITKFLGGVTNNGTITASGGIGLKLGYVTSPFGFVGFISSFTGNISNSGKIIGSTGIFISSAVTFTGGAIINSGTISGSTNAINASAASSAVTIDQNAGTIAGNVLLSSHADVMTIAGGTVTGNIVGQNAGTLNFSLGSGTTYTDSNTFTLINQVNINSGTVLLTGSGTDTATNIDVLSGATLGGTAALDPDMTIHSGGTFAPGVPGTFMQVTGSLTLQSAAIYMVSITGANSSGANVIGSATITGAIFAVAAGNTAINGTDYPVLLTTSAVTGQFSNARVYLAGGLLGTLDYTTHPDDVFLDVGVAAIVPLLPPGAPQNVINVANAIDQAIANGATPPPNFQNLFNFTPAQLETALSQLSGQDDTGAATSTFQLMNDFFNLLSDMTFAGGGGGAGGGGTASGFAPETRDALPPDVALAYDQVLATKSPPRNFAQRWNSWGSAYGGSATYNGNAAIGSNTVNASDYGFAGGMDYYATPDLKLGFALAGAGTNWHLSQNLGSGRSDVFQAAGYAIAHFGPAYISGIAAFGNSWFTTNRTAAFGDQLRAKFDGQSYGLRTEGGYRFAMLPTAGITPYGAVQTQWFLTPAYGETDLNGGGFALSYGAQSANDTRSEIGARADDLAMLGETPLVLRARAAWAHDWISNPALGATFQALPGGAFTVNGAKVPANSALASAGAQLFLTPNWSIEAKFNGEFASSAQTYAGTGTLKYSW